MEELFCESPYVSKDYTQISYDEWKSIYTTLSSSIPPSWELFDFHRSAFLVDKIHSLCESKNYFIYYMFLDKIGNSIVNTLKDIKMDIHPRKLYTNFRYVDNKIRLGILVSRL